MPDSSRVTMITEDELNWHLFTATRSLIKPKSGCVTFTLYWQKAVCLTSQTVL